MVTVPWISCPRAAKKLEQKKWEHKLQRESELVTELIYIESEE